MLKLTKRQRANIKKGSLLHRIIQQLSVSWKLELLCVADFTRNLVVKDSETGNIFTLFISIPSGPTFFNTDN